MHTHSAHSLRRCPRKCGPPLHGGFWVLGLPGLGFTITGSSCSAAIFWDNSSNLEYREKTTSIPYAVPLETQEHTEEPECHITYLCLRLAASLFSSVIALSAARALSYGRQTDPNQCWHATHEIKERKKNLTQLS